MAEAAGVPQLPGLAERRAALEKRFAPWRPRTLAAALDEVARSHPDRPFLITDTGTLTYAELADWSRQIARGLVRRGVAPGPPAAAGSAPHRASVLVVDDALTVRELQRSILERAGYTVRVAGNGEEALALLSEGPADLVLSDVEMPLVDGFALTEAVVFYGLIGGLLAYVLV